MAQPIHNMLGSCRLFFEGDKDSLLDDGKLYTVKMTTDITHLFSSDSGHEREGTVAVAINDQATLTSFRGTSDRNAFSALFHRNQNVRLYANHQVNLTDQVVFFGKPKMGRLAASVTVVESDDRTKSVLEQIAKYVDMAGTAAGVALPSVPLAGQGADLASKAFTLMSKIIDNDVELQSVASFCRTGKYTMQRMGDDDKPEEGIKCVFEVAEVKEGGGDDIDVVVSISSVGVRSGDGNKDYDSKRDTFPRARGARRNFVFSSTVGSGPSETQFNVSAPHQNGGVPVSSVLGIHNAVIFSGKWKRGRPLPVSFSLGTSAYTDKLEDPIKELIEAAAAVAASAHKGSAARVMKVSKASQSAVSVVYNLRPTFMKDMRQKSTMISVAEPTDTCEVVIGQDATCDQIVLVLNVSHGAVGVPPPPKAGPPPQ